ncbi:MAG: hypothetical protein ACJ8KU_08495 [Chthoniobacterales bacterium]
MSALLAADFSAPLVELVPLAECLPCPPLDGVLAAPEEVSDEVPPVDELVPGVLLADERLLRELGDDERVGEVPSPAVLALGEAFGEALTEGLALTDADGDALIDGDMLAEGDALIEGEVLIEGEALALVDAPAPVDAPVPVL